MALTDLLFSRIPVTDLTTGLVFGDDAAPVVVPTQPVTTALVFSESAATGSPVSLVFGAEAPIDTTVTEFTLDGTLDQPALSILIVGGPITDYSIDGTLAQPPLTAALDLRIVSTLDFFALLPDAPLVGDIEARYITNTARPTVGQTVNDWQTGSRTTQSGVAQGHQDTGSAPAGWAAFWSKTLGIGDTIVGGLPYALRPVPVNQDTRFEQGTPTRTATGFKHQDAHRTRTGSDGKFQDATPRRSDTFFRHQDGDRTKRATLGTQWQVATRLTQAQWSSFQLATDHPVGLLARHQDAMRPGAGVSVVIVVPTQPDYTPSAHLLFECPPLAHPHLVFGAQVCYVDPPIVGTIIIPAREVYMLTNDVALHRLDNGLVIQALSFSLSLDLDSWTWTFSAEIPYWYFDDVQRIAPDVPVELEASVNGASIRVLAEELTRDRVFGSTSLRLSGRGLNAILDNPYSPIMNFGNTSDRTMQQLAADALTVNGVSNGWAVDWHPVDWIVPANTWAHKGTYASALSALAQSAGAYAQPHPTLNMIKVLRRYPALPWEWGSVTPDYVLPAEAVTVEDISWLSKPAYNRVFVNGEKSGVSVQATRTGQAGGMLAPPIVDSLMTTVEAARARAEAALSDTGDQTLIRLRLPVFPETGIILPGSFVRYVDGATERLGLVRAFGLEASPAESWQTLEVESHA